MIFKYSYKKSIIACALIISACLPALVQARGFFRSYGDSITAGYKLVQNDRYPEMMSQSLQLDYENLAVSGQTSCQMSYNQVFRENINSQRESLFSTMVIGTNDSNAEGAGPYQKVFEKCLTATVAWLAFPKSDKFSPFNAACTRKGQWLPSVEMPTTGLRSRDQNDELNCTISTDGSPIYLWHDFGDDLYAQFNVMIDNQVASNVSTHADIQIKTHDGRGVRGQSLLKFQVAAGIHNVKFVIRSNNGHYATIYGIGSLKNRQAPVQMFTAGVPFQLNQNRDTEVSLYNSIVERVVTQFQNEGFPLQFVNIRQYWKPITEEMMDNLHPNRVGNQSLSKAFIEKIIAFRKVP